MSVVLPETLRSRLAREARKRGLGLSPTMRALLAERVDEIDSSEQVTRAEEWQRAQAWATWGKIKSGDRDEVERGEIARDFERVLRRK